MITLAQHAKKGRIRRLTLSVVADATGTVAPFRLPKFEGVLLALGTSPDGQTWPGAYDVYLRVGTWDLFEGAGLARDARRPTRAVIRYADCDIHPCLDESDAAVLDVTGLPAGARVTVSITYGVEK